MTFVTFKRNYNISAKFSASEYKEIMNFKLEYASLTGVFILQSRNYIYAFLSDKLLNMKLLHTYPNILNKPVKVALRERTHASTHPHSHARTHPRTHTHINKRNRRQTK